MRSKRGFSAPVVGGSSLLIIFAVLCLTVLAMLSLTTVQADQWLSLASADHVTGYYQADTQAEEILARLRSGEIPDGVSSRGGLYEYACPISDTQALSVSVRLEGEDYQILRWKAVSTTEWAPDEGITVWDGGMPDGID